MRLVTGFTGVLSVGFRTGPKCCVNYNALLMVIFKKLLYVHLQFQLLRFLYKNAKQTNIFDMKLKEMSII